jgi:protein-disulfide isomerase
MTPTNKLPMSMALCLLFLSTLSLGARPARAESEPSELSTLKQDLETVKSDLSEIKKELGEIRKLLSQRPAQAAQPANVAAKVSVGDGPILGKKDAPVTLIEFSDYQCPFCGRFFNNTFATLKTDYIDTGKVRYVFRDFPLDTIHPQARKAAEAAHCAGEQGKYWEMHDTLFKNQGALIADNLKHFARELGLETDAFNACLDQGKYADAVNQHQAAGSAAGITGTPGFFVGKTGADGTIEATFIKGAQPVTTFRQVIDRLLEEQKS